MSFIDSIVKKIGVDLGLVPLKYKAVIFGELGVFFENVKSIKSFEKDEIVLTVKNKEIVIKGKELSVKNYVDGDLVIMGEVKEISVKWKNF